MFPNSSFPSIGDPLQAQLLHPGSSFSGPYAIAQSVSSVFICFYLFRVSQKGHTTGKQKSEPAGFGKPSGGVAETSNVECTALLSCFWSDIAATSVEQCELRFKDMGQRGRGRGSFQDKMFDAEFIVADCTKVSAAFCNAWYSGMNWERAREGPSRLIVRKRSKLSKD